jgi:hypothetical protein
MWGVCSLSHALFLVVDEGEVFVDSNQFAVCHVKMFAAACAQVPRQTACFDGTSIMRGMLVD